MDCETHSSHVRLRNENNIVSSSDVVSCVKNDEKKLCKRWEREK